MEYELIGTIVPAVKCILKPGEAMYTQSGGMMMYTGDINYSTGLRGGVVKSVARQLLARESAFMTTYYAEKHMGIVIFSTTIPGTIQCLKLEKGSSMICQKTAFLCAEEQIMADVVFTKDYVLVCSVEKALYYRKFMVRKSFSGNSRGFNYS